MIISLIFIFSKIQKIFLLLLLYIYLIDMFIMKNFLKKIVNVHIYLIHFFIQD